MSRFKKLRFPIYTLDPSIDIRDQFPELKKHRKIANSNYPNINLVLRYIIFMYDPNSDLIREVPDLAQRKLVAAEYAGFKDHTAHLDEIMECRDHKVLDLIFLFLTEIYHSRKYREWQTLCQELDENNRLRWDQLGAKKDKEDTDERLDILASAEKKQKLREYAQKMNQMIDVLEKELFGDNEDIKNVAIIMRYSSPENFANSTAA